MTTVATPAPITETDAINYMLNAIGEAPIASIVGATQADVVSMIALLKSVTGEIQRMKWRFNTEFGYQLQPSGQIVWTDINGVTETLNVFEKPANLASYNINPSVAQSGVLYPDMSIRRAQFFQDPAGSGSYPLVFYDRGLNREGLNAQAYPFLGIDPVWYMPYEDMPDTARLYCAAKAARMSVERNVNSSEIAQFVKTDEAFSYSRLRRDEGIRDNWNMLRNVNGWRWTGMRPTVNVGFIDRRGAKLSVPAPTEPALPTLSISPSSPTATKAPSSTFTEVWTITNTASVGGPTGTYQVALLVDGVNVLSAVSSINGLFQLPPQASQSATVTYATGPSAGTGTVTLLVMNGTTSDASSVLTVTVT